MAPYCGAPIAAPAVREPSRSIRACRISCTSSRTNCCTWTGRSSDSVRRLLFSPGFLTREHFEGRRSRWMNPIRLYLIFSLLYFGAAALASTQEMRVHVSGTTAQEEAEGLQRFGYASQQEAEEALAHARAKWAPRVMFLLVPFYAWLIQLTARRSGRNYPQHLYFALHVHAAWFALGALAAAVSLVTASLRLARRVHAPGCVRPDVCGPRVPDRHTSGPSSNRPGGR